jgi:hypothetical protein
MEEAQTTGVKVRVKNAAVNGRAADQCDPK